MTVHLTTAPAPLRVLAPSPLLSSPIAATLMRLAWPNMIAMLATALVAVAETSYVGLLGTPPLAAIALVFPMVMLQQMLSAGSMGGGVSSAVSRALGAGDERRAQALALHAVVIAVAAALLFSAIFLVFGPSIYGLLGGTGPVLGEALLYSNIYFTGLAGVWLANTLASVVRGSGDMKTPSAILLGAALLQIGLSGGLGLGLGPLPRLGMAGVALGAVIAFAVATLVLFAYLRTGRSRVRLVFSPSLLHGEMFRDILKVGGLSCLSPLQTVLVVLILTRIVAQFGQEALAGYGIGARLEFLLIPVTFAIGVASLPLVGMAIGAGNIARARRVAWTGGGLSALVLGVVGMVVWLFPELWAGLFTKNPHILASARAYFAWAAPGYAFLGFGLALYFAAQGAGKVLGPVLAGTARLAIVAIGGWWLTGWGAPDWAMFALIAVGMVAYGVLTALSVALVPWGERR
ncbi:MULTISPECIES: MATE family efflux transporter [Rhodomicrobium]|uniref:MATE family efflux transporter n=1 Tax=Rhodomicrobium TaxID=1068 RepID=UPI000B4B3BB8|nr:MULTISPECIES: MATE family efflux transporter [Rhodomicrobium]